MARTRSFEMPTVMKHGPGAIRSLGRRLLLWDWRAAWWSPIPVSGGPASWPRARAPRGVKEGLFGEWQNESPLSPH